ncbi:unnamed protein product [Mycena citricolor]|uniref:Uncharacterized protein n=1 Tax=Mycena citricolor TaxID=2018698 RepID=A0AAD2HWE8_9AGAR|nr:unnamed protein product [Mycena citricolor]
MGRPIIIDHLETCPEEISRVPYRCIFVPWARYHKCCTSQRDVRDRISETLSDI